MVQAGKLEFVQLVKEAPFYALTKFQPPSFFSGGVIGGQSTPFSEIRIFWDFLIKKTVRLEKLKLAGIMLIGGSYTLIKFCPANCFGLGNFGGGSSNAKV